MSTLPLDLQSIATANRTIYQQNLPDDCIRVLKLHANGDSDGISCDLDVVKLDNALPFHALSYCWGKARANSTISCNGQRLSVTSNLYEALEQLRHGPKARLLWIDAICIDQGNTSEKTKQVSMMSRIFAKATRVIVWLGLEDDVTDLALETVQDIWASCYSRQTGMPTYDKLHEEISHDEQIWQLLRANIASVIPNKWQYGTDQRARALRTFFDRPWFSRVWVIQEVRACADILVCIGAQTIPWNMVALTAAWVVYAPSPVTRITEPYKFRGILHTDLMRQRIQTTMDDVPFLELLDRCRSFQSSINKDRVFALLQHPVAREYSDAELSGLGTVNEHEKKRFFSYQQPNLNMKVDYELTLLQVYRQIVLGSITEGSSLQVLSHADEDQAHRIGYPTWMPVWHTTSSRFTGPRRTFLYNASGGSQPKVFNLPDPTLLGLRGVICGKVSEMSMNVELFSDPSSTIPGQGMRFGTSLEEMWELSKLVVRDCWQPEHNWSQEPMCRVASNPDLHFQDFCIFMHERMQRSTETMMISLHGKWCDICHQRHVVSSAANAAETLVILHCETCFDFDVCKSCHDNGKTCPGAHKLSPRRIPGILCRLDDQAKDLIMMHSRGGISQRFDLGARQSFDEQMFFRLDNGYIGIGPEVIRPTDVVVIFFGSRVPFVLRSQSDKYSIIGQCYVHGLMDGAAVDEQQIRKLGERDFVLV